MGFVMFGGFFFDSLTPFTYLVGGYNFLNSNPFWWFLACQMPDVPIARVQTFFAHRNNQALPLDPACPERLSDCWRAALPHSQILL